MLHQPAFRYFTLLLFLTAISSAAAQGKRELSGSIIDIDGKPAAGCTVSLYRYNGLQSGPLDTTVTASNGHFRLKGTVPGTFALQIKDRKGFPRMVEPIAVTSATPLDMEIRFREIQPGPALAMFDVKFNDATVAGLYEAAWGMRDRELRFMEAVLQHQMAGESDTSFSYDLTPAFLAVEHAIASKQPPLVHDAWILNYISLVDLSDTATFDTTRFHYALTKIPASSQLWALFPKVAVVAAEASGGISSHLTLLESITRENPSIETRTKVLFNLMLSAVRTKDTASIRHYVHRLGQEFPDTYEAQKALADYDPDRAIIAGKKVPPFSFTSLDDSTRTISNETLLGKYYLIDFWATWCMPCMAEQGNLHQAYTRFKDHNFEIISLSLDQSPDWIARLRSQGKYPMPWQHGWMEGGYKNPMATLFGITGIPRPLLIGPDGTILVDNSSRLRGQLLERTLSQYLPQ